MAFFALVLAFLLGALVVMAAEGLALYLAFFRLRWKTVVASESPREPSDLDAEQWLASARSKQGVVWFLENENVPKVSLTESQTGGPKELKVKKGTVQIQPVKKYAKIKDRLLILSDPDGSQETIKLLDCTILAVSSSNLSSKKWAKRYPIRLEIKSSTVNDGSKTCYLYIDSAWEKESWCKALRLASSRDNKLVNWYEQVSKEFNHYLASFSAEFPSFLKPSALQGEIVEKTIRVDGSSSSKVRIFLKKLTKKASKGGVEGRANSVLASTRDARKTAEKIVTLNDVTSAEGSVKSSLEDKCSSSSFQDLAQLDNKGLYPIMTDAVGDEKHFGDVGTLCWNLLLSRLFFDAKRSAEVNSFVKTRIQKTLSNMRTPSYIGGIACANLDLGNLPPYIHKIRVLPMDLTEVWAVDVDIEYLGGLLLDIETRIEVCEPEMQEDFINASSEPNYSGETTSLLEGFEYYSNQLNSSTYLADQLQKIDQEGEVDSLKQSKSSTQASVRKSKWKTILHSIAEQVSQVPLSLGIRITSLRGTVRFHIRPPPSDQLWFAFTSMPDIDWQLESSVGDRKITSSHIAFFMGNRFKAAFRDSLVLPNCESICIPWMVAEKDDWVPQKAAPFIWIKQEATTMDTTTTDKPNSSSTTTTASSDDRIEKIKDVVYVEKPISCECSSTSEELMSALLVRTMNRSQDSSISSNLTSEDSSIITRAMDENSSSSALSEEDVKPKKVVGRRARMMDLGKKMGEKFEEKKRHIEEKSRLLLLKK